MPDRKVTEKSWQGVATGNMTGRWTEDGMRMIEGKDDRKVAEEMTGCLRRRQDG